MANWTTTLGAVCFLAVALAALVGGMTFKAPRPRPVALERALEGFAREVEVDVEVRVESLERESIAEFDRVERFLGRELGEDVEGFE